jgi:endonuclease YncB( thermonuclease family)
VSCAPVSLDQHGGTVATCRVDGVDLGEWLVRQGLALDWPRYSSGRYRDAENDPARAGRGIWAGGYVEPWLYRACIRAGGRQMGGRMMRMRIRDDRLRHITAGSRLIARLGLLL